MKKKKKKSWFSNSGEIVLNKFPTDPNHQYQRVSIIFLNIAV